MVATSVVEGASSWYCRSFNTTVDLMCEARYGGLFRGIQPLGDYRPEYGSTVTSLFMLYVGVHILLFWRTDVQMLMLVGSTFFVNGWSAFVSHGTGNELASIVDRWSFVFTACARSLPARPQRNASSGDAMPPPCPAVPRHPAATNVAHASGCTEHRAV